MFKTDTEIIELINSRATREAGFRELIRSYKERLYYTIRRQVDQHADADDILQNTFLKVFRYWESFEGRSGLYTWIFRIASNEIANHFQLKKKMTMIEWDNEKFDRPGGTQDVNNIPKLIEQLITALPEQQQKIFRLRYYEEMPYKKMADMLHLSEGSLKASFHIAVKKIEQQLKSNPDFL